MLFFKILFLCAVSFVADSCAMQQADLSTSQLPVLEYPNVWENSSGHALKLANMFSSNRFEADSCVTEVKEGTNNAGIFIVEASLLHKDPPEPLIIKYLSDNFDVNYHIKDLQTIIAYGVCNNVLNPMAKVLGIVFGKNSSNKQCVAEVMEKARGRSLETILCDENMSCVDKQRVWSAVGKAFAFIHQRTLEDNGVAVVLTDPNTSNVFVDSDNGDKVTFIDFISSANATPPNSEKQSIGWDFTALIMTLFLARHWIFKADDQFELALSCTEDFLRAYLMSFTSVKRVRLSEHLRIFFNAWMNVVCAIKSDHSIDQYVTVIGYGYNANYYYTRHIKFELDAFRKKCKESPSMLVTVKERCNELKEMFNRVCNEQVYMVDNSTQTEEHDEMGLKSFLIAFAVSGFIWLLTS